MRKLWIVIALLALFVTDVYASDKQNKQIAFNSLSPLAFGESLREYFGGAHYNKASNVRKAYDQVEKICGAAKTSLADCRRSADLATAMLDEFYFSVGKNADLAQVWASAEKVVPPADPSGMRKILDVAKLKAEPGKVCANPSSPQCREQLISFGAALQKYGFSELNNFSAKVSLQPIVMADIPTGAAAAPAPAAKGGGAAKSKVTSLNTRPRAGAIRK